MAKLKKPAYDRHTVELINCVMFAVNHLKSNGGLVMTTHPNGNISAEPFTEKFCRALEPYGYKVNRTLLRYQRATQAEKKRLEKEPKVRAALQAYRAKCEGADRKPASPPA